jgi:hypothetical protein
MQHGMLPRNIDLYDKNTGQFQWPVRWCGRALNATPTQKSTNKFAFDHAADQGLCSVTLKTCGGTPNVG